MISLRQAVLSCVFLIAGILPAAAFAAEKEAGTVTAYYMVKDPAAQGGYQTKVSWELTDSSEWKNFYNRIPQLPEDVSKEPDPFLRGAEEIIVLTEGDIHNLSGFDIYLSARGLTLMERSADHYYYPDTSKIRKFLQEEQELRAPFEKFDSEIIDKKSPGIVVTYNLNKNIPNLDWLISSPEEIKIYDSFLLTLRPYTNNEVVQNLDKNEFEGFDTFILNLNYPRAPAKIVTVSTKSVRMSNPKITKRFYQDKEDFFNFFKSQAREVMDYRAKYKINMSKDPRRSAF